MDQYTRKNRELWPQPYGASYERETVATHHNSGNRGNWGHTS
jgi:hypothetical protein